MRGYAELVPDGENGDHEIHWGEFLGTRTGMVEQGNISLCLLHLGGSGFKRGFYCVALATPELTL